MNEVITFWFEEIKPSQWYQKSDVLDNLIRERFLEIHAQAVSGELSHWRETALGRLAEIIVIDQFSRNMFRGHPKSFLYDPIALILAQEAVRLGIDRELDDQQVPFLYMPYMHSESKLVHKEALRIFSQERVKKNLDYEIAHKKIIDRFGRYPHRNIILGRQSSEEEIEFLKEPNSSF